MTVLNPLSAERSPCARRCCRSSSRRAREPPLHRPRRHLRVGPSSSAAGRDPAADATPIALLVGRASLLPGWATTRSPLGFFDLKGVVETLSGTAGRAGRDLGAAPIRAAPGSHCPSSGQRPERRHRRWLHPQLRAALDLPDLPVALMGWTWMHCSPGGAASRRWSSSRSSRRCSRTWRAARR